MFEAMEEAERPPRLGTNVEGFYLHAATTEGAGDRSPQSKFL